MNIALSAILALLIFIPGILFRRSYLSSRFSSNFIKSDFQFEVLFAFIPAIIILYLFDIVGFLNGIGLSIDKIGDLLTGKAKVNELSTILVTKLTEIIHFNLKIWIFSLVSGHLARHIVIYFGFDLIVKILQFPNKWEYILTGLIPLLGEIDKYSKESDIQKSNRKFIIHIYKTLGIKYIVLFFKYIKFIITLRKQNFLKEIDFIYLEIYYDKDILYSGRLLDYHLDTNGSLNSIILQYPSRKIFVRPETNVEWETIHLEYIILNYELIHNVTFENIKLNERPSVRSFI
jgi:hypothetical protein